MARGSRQSVTIFDGDLKVCKGPGLRIAKRLALRQRLSLSVSLSFSLSFYSAGQFLIGLLSPAHQGTRTGRCVGPSPPGHPLWPGSVGSKRPASILRVYL